MVSEVLQSISILLSGLMHPGHCLDLEGKNKVCYAYVESLFLGGPEVGPGS